ncbi:substrate-binding domain-containing protein, partial [Burkholderia cenocepacia]|uniref:substrate-binding domain-containing protein n=1 Tax=Burkholderia cenocepacia TaxID=95486 RepID=UPI002011E99A
ARVPASPPSIATRIRRDTMPSRNWSTSTRCPALGAFGRNAARRGVRAALFAANAPVALAIARHLRARFGAAWQQKAALLSIDDPEWAELIGITTIRQPTYEIGYKAVEFVHERIDGAAGDVRVAMLPGELIARASTAS